MKRQLLIATLAAVSALSLSAQSFTIFKKSGEAVSYNNSTIDRIEFSINSMPEDPEPPEVTLIDFNTYMTELKPMEGIINPKTTPLGLGRISISMEGVYYQNSNSQQKITLSNSEGVVFAKGPTDDGMYIYRNVMDNSTEFVYEFNPDGYLTPGNYSLYIPEGIYVDTNDNPLSCKICIYLIEQPAPAQAYVTTPAPGTIETLEEVTLRFNNYIVTETTSSLSASVKNAQSGTSSVAAVNVLSDGTIAISLSPALTTPGTYNITIDKGGLRLQPRDGDDGKQYLNDEINLVYEIEGAPVLPPKIGDFYYSDGTWSPYLIERAGIDPIGVVFYIGEASEFGDHADYYKVKDGSAALSEFHGYVVALRDATCINDENTSVPFSFFDGNDTGCGCSTEVEDFLGYNNTLSIRQRAERDFGGLSAETTNFPAAYYATDYFESQVPAPAQSSGWFLPSAYQLQYIYDRVYFVPNGGDDTDPCVDNSLIKLVDKGGMQMYVRDSEYWTSTEQYDSSGCSYRAYYMSFDSSAFDPGFVSWLNKNQKCRVRSILAF